MANKKDKKPTSTSKPRKPARSKKTRKSAAKATPRGLSFKRLLLKTAIITTGIGVLSIVIYSVYLSQQVARQFEGKRFAIPAKVYAQPQALYPGLALTIDQLETALKQLDYHREPSINTPGDYQRHPQSLDIFARSFIFWDGERRAKKFRVNFHGDTIRSLQALDGAAKLPSIRLEPLYIGGIYPNHGEDRELVRLAQAPATLLEALLVVEDVRYYQHFGIDLRGTARAAYKTLTGQRLEGGSTLTQQLVKNFFLTPERTLQRKLKEMLMAIILDARYDKNDILETYLNEVYLGQDKDRSIHGFGLAAQFYFQKNIADLKIHESALLVGMLKGPAYYNPRRNPQRALERRNIVINQLQKYALIDEHTATAAKQQPLGVTPVPHRGQSRFPAFIDLVVKQLQRDYRKHDLQSEGLRIFTTLVPRIQQTTESQVSQQLSALENQRHIPTGFLQAAAIITNVHNGEVQALVGDRHVKYPGYNRALKASRQIGSLLKPAIYLTALLQPKNYSLLTPLDDSPLSVAIPGQDNWQPQNYDHTFHGDIPLWLALSRSYNVPAAKLGLNLGLDTVSDTLTRLGVPQIRLRYPSELLGSVQMTPFQISQMYHTIANGGFYSPLRAIRAVTNANGAPLERYQLQVEQRFPLQQSYLIDWALQQVTRVGTARRLSSQFPDAYPLAGKTGTTDDYRDSWFAGYSQQHLGVIWVGNDDNQTTGLTGSSGAMTIWAKIFADISVPPTSNTHIPPGIAQVNVDRTRGWPLQNCKQPGLSLPFIAFPKKTLGLKDDIRQLQELVCDNKRQKTTTKPWYKRLFGG